MFRKWMCLLLAVLLSVTLCGGARAEGITVENRRLEMGESSVSYPVLGGMEDRALQEAVNRQIAGDGKFPEYLARMSQLLSGGSLQVTWTGGVMEDVFSCAVAAEGAVESLRPGYVWTWSNVDLLDGHEIVFSELFTDEEAARAALEEILEWDVAPELSAHLLNSELVPLPEGFFLERSGLTLLYPLEQLSTLHDRAGAVRIGWNEIRDMLNLEEGSILSRIGAGDMVELTEASGAEIARMTEEGALPDIPVTLGDSLKELTDRAGLLIDPDIYDGGRMFSLEGAAFRDVFLLTDYLSERWDDSRVSGIRMDRGCVFGLCVGSTRREEWRAVLGEPENSVIFDDERAEAGRTVPGSCDYYRFGEHQLRLHCDEDGVLTSVILTE